MSKVAWLTLALVSACGSSSKGGGGDETLDTGISSDAAGDGDDGWLYAFR